MPLIWYSAEGGLAYRHGREGDKLLLWTKNRGKTTSKAPLLQSTLGFETLDIAAALDLETATPLTDPRQYINSNLGFRNLKI